MPLVERRREPLVAHPASVSPGQATNDPAGAPAPGTTVYRRPARLRRPFARPATVRQQLLAGAPRPPNLATRLWRQAARAVQGLPPTGHAFGEAQNTACIAAAPCIDWQLQLVAAPGGHPDGNGQSLATKARTAPSLARPTVPEPGVGPTTWALPGECFGEAQNSLGAAALHGASSGASEAVELVANGRLELPDRLALLRAPLDEVPLHTRLLALPGGLLLPWPEVGYLGVPSVVLEEAVCPISLAGYTQMHLPVALRTGSTWQLFDLPPLLVHLERARRARRPLDNPLSRERLTLPGDLRFVVRLLPALSTSG